MPATRTRIVTLLLVALGVCAAGILVASLSSHSHVAAAPAPPAPQPSPPPQHPARAYDPSQDLVGRCAPPFAIGELASGASYAFEPVSHAERPTLLLFWSVDCDHCRTEIPRLAAWSKRHPAAAQVIAVARVDEGEPSAPASRAATRAFARSHGLPWVVLADEGGSIAKLYHVAMTPAAFFIASDGAIKDVWYFAHALGFEKALSAQLGRTKATVACTPTETAPAGAELHADAASPAPGSTPTP